MNRILKPAVSVACVLSLGAILLTSNAPLSGLAHANSEKPDKTEEGEEGKEAEASTIPDLEQAKKEQATLDGVILKSAEGGFAVLEEEAAKQSATLKNLIEDLGIKDPIPIPNLLTNMRLAFISTTLSQMAEKKDDAEKRKYIKEQLTPTGSSKYLEEGQSHEAFLQNVVLDANYLDIKILLEVALDVYGQRIFVEDLEKIGDMTAKQYEAYKNETIAPLSGVPRDIRGFLIERNLRSSIYRFNPPVTPRDLDIAEAQMVAYVVKHNTASAAELPPVLSEQWAKSERAKTFLFDSIKLPDRCPLPNHPDYNPNSPDKKPDERYVDNKDGTVTDLCTKLIWEKTPSPEKFKWRQGNVHPAKDHCDELVKAGFSDWRLPPRFELESLIDKTQRPSLNSVFTDGNASFWSSSAHVGKPSNAWGVNFNFGNVFYNDIGYLNRVRCVR